MLIIRGVEVTQAIQYHRADQHLTDSADRGPDNSLRLVAGKPAWARVYVESDVAGTIPNVTGTLQVDYGFMSSRSGQPGITLNPQPPGTVTAQFNPDYDTTRSSAALTLNFVIPAGRMFGPLALKASVTDGNQSAEHHLNIGATLRQTLQLRGIMVGYNGPDPANPANNLVVAAPGVADLQTTAAWAMRIMPVSATGVFQVASTITRNVALTGTATNGGCTQAWLTLNAAIATAQAADGNHPGFLYYGLLASGFPNTSNNGGCASSGVSAGFNGGQGALAHEIGHMCGRAHGPCGGVGTSADPNYPAYEPYDTPAARVASIGEFGLDITSGAVPDPANARDYMSYCGPAWISIYGHRALINNQALNPEFVGTRRPWWKDYLRYDRWWWLHYKPDPPPYWIDPRVIEEFPPRMQNVITVIGVLHPDQTVEVLSVTRSEVISTELKGDTTDMRMALLGPRGAELASAPIVAMASRAEGCGCGGGCSDDKDQPRMFQAFVPDAGVGTALSIRRGKSTVWKRVAPKSKLSVTGVKLRASGDAALEVAWSTSLPARTGEAWVRVSSDEGKTWRSVATGVVERKAVIELEHVPAGNVLFEVVVHDGFRSLRSKPVPFENAALAPVPAILHPHEGRTLVERETLCLWGSVANQPESAGDRYSYLWKLDGKPVGEELQVYTQVPERGKHRCELIVRDAKGKALRSTSVEFVSVAADKE